MIDLLGYLDFLIETKKIGDLTFFVVGFGLLFYGAIEFTLWGISKIENILGKMVAFIPEKEFMLTKMPQKYEQMETGLVLFNTNTEKYLSVEEEWNGHDGYDIFYKWADSTSCLLINGSGHRNSGFSWKKMVGYVGREIHACLLVPVEIFIHDTMFGRHRGFFMNANFINAFRFQDELDDVSSNVLKKILNGLKNNE